VLSNARVLPAARWRPAHGLRHLATEPSILHSIVPAGDEVARTALLPG
jgi:hypothetical protein